MSDIAGCVTRGQAAGHVPFVHSLAECTPDFCVRWNRALEEARYPHLYQSYEWAALRARLGWEAQFVGLADGDQILAGAAVLSRSLPGGYYRIATAPCGPFWIPGREHLLPALFRLIHETTAPRGAIFCRMNVPCSAHEVSGLAVWLPNTIRRLAATWTYWNLPRAQMDLDISSSPETILAHMHHKARYHYRAALRRGITVEENIEARLADFEELMKELGRRKNIRVHDAEYFRALLTQFGPSRAVFLTAGTNGRLLSGQIVARLGSEAYYLYGATRRDSLHGASEAVYVAAIQWAKRHGCNHLNLGGTCTGWPPSPEAKGYGVYDYKRRLGATARLLAPYLDLVTRPVLYRAVRAGEELLLPLALETGSGKFKVIWERLRRRPGTSCETTEP